MGLIWDNIFKKHPTVTQQSLRIFFLLLRHQLKNDLFQETFPDSPIYKLSKGGDIVYVGIFQENFI
jgi:hypothetical protein